MLWENEADTNGEVIWVNQGAETYTHMICLRVTAEIAKSQRVMDDGKTRAELSEERLHSWLKRERFQLQKQCLKHGIFSTEIGGRDSSLRLSKLPQFTALVKDFQAHDEAASEAALAHREGLETLLLLDANKTLTAQDTGMMFWQHLGRETGSTDNPLETLFKTEGSTYQSFRKARLLYEGVMCSFTEICDTVTAEVAMYPEMLELLLRAKNQPHIAAVVVTCGIQYV
jgi:hypothetical protein